MTSLASVAAYLPSHSESIAEYLREYGFSDREIRIYRHYYGFSDIRTDPDLGMAGQLIAAGRALTALKGQEHRVRYVLQARTMPVAAPYPLNPLHEARTALGLDHALAFSVNQQACASALVSVELAGRMLEEDGDPDALALVFAGEKTFTSDSHVLGITAVMGEGVAAILVRPGGGSDHLLGYAVRTHGAFHRASRMTEADHEKWTAMYTEGICEVVTAALDHAGLSVTDVDLILPHNVNRLSWLNVLKKLRIDQKERLYLDNLADLGHCFGADAFLNYRSASDAGRLKPGDHYVMTAVGLGATFSAMVFEH